MPDVATRAADVADDLAGDLDLLRGATAAAAALALDLFHRGDFSRWDKSPGNPVSTADLAVDAQLKADLLGARPGYGWLSEETADDPARLACRRVWIVDPIDGTRDFLGGRTGWAVSIALIEDGVAMLAALAAPARGQVFEALRGGGATLNGAPIVVSGMTSFFGVRLPVDPISFGEPLCRDRWTAVAVETPNSLALRTAHVASDVADGFIHGRTIAEWDVAAATLLVAEAGGVVTDRDGAPLRFNQPDPAVAGIVAATPALHDLLRDELGARRAAYAAMRARG